MPTPDDILSFWFDEHGPQDWFGGAAAFDALLAERFGAVHPLIAAGEAWAWRTSPGGRLAEIIVLDQFSRQLYRGSARAFATDGMALVLAQEAVAGGHDLELEPVRRKFLYMPYMHSESLHIHEEALRLFTALGDEDTLGYERAHVEVLERFGRYPRRNAALGRQSTPAELDYIASGSGMF
ncbi:DUF924 family protein [Devosia sp.]|uniref:DUF924 family protein n=1 Tax=Devosia sp. TaxID=1871048 RepID=UPI002EEA0C75